MNRRELLQCAALLVSGTAVTPGSWALSQAQSKYLSARAPYIETATADFFTDAQRAAVAAAADITIPITGTPGALDAGVPRFIELMVSDWLTDEERANFMGGLEDLQARAGGDFSALPAPKQLALLEALEDEAADAPWYQFANTLRTWDPEAPFICAFKELTVLGFMLSREGSREFLRPNPMGTFDGDIPLLATDSAYSKHTLLRAIARESS
ncbi:gluconate 2-dehydrogenase subunit 3 family protein [Halioglobus pacificus]|uniref:Twin-arginine translocation pathway signal protein n=1 Tax=Parahalioglobus pacificus TaxID=930806 RepID=A0A919CLV9_9GAMM|nr:gluconate 2-dehydrogenase subunit 3 family protein [Halioglobus pacificus]GHD35670.1 twin-arginine translocation pathway signal protein [Halioglobus pacificus]